MTNSALQLIEMIEQLEAEGKQPKITRLPSTAKRNRKMMLRGKRTTM
jgi:hypothetical protein